MSNSSKSDINRSVTYYVRVLLAGLALIAFSDTSRAGLAAHWDMNQLDNGRIQDTVSKRVGELRGNQGLPTLVKTQNVSGVSFDSNAMQWIKVDASGLDLSFEQGMVITATVYVPEGEAGGDGYYTIVTDDNVPDQHGFWLGLRYRIVSMNVSGDGGIKGETFEAFTLKPGQTHVIKAFFKPGEFIGLSLDGVTHKIPTQLKKLFVGEGQILSIGARHYKAVPINGFFGVIDDLKIFDAYDQDEIPK